MPPAPRRRRHRQRVRLATALVAAAAALSTGILVGQQWGRGALLWWLYLVSMACEVGGLSFVILDLRQAGKRLHRFRMNGGRPGNPIYPSHWKSHRPYFPGKGLAPLGKAMPRSYYSGRPHGESAERGVERLSERERYFTQVHPLEWRKDIMFVADALAKRMHILNRIDGYLKEYDNRPSTFRPWAGPALVAIGILLGTLGNLVSMGG